MATRLFKPCCWGMDVEAANIVNRSVDMGRLGFLHRNGSLATSTSGESFRYGNNMVFDDHCFSRLP